jgi:hypothetical protein
VNDTDVTDAVALAVATLGTAVDRDWQVPAGGLTWTCWETLEHIADDLFTYAAQLGPATPSLTRHVPIGWQYRRPGGPGLTIFTDPQDGPAGMLLVLETCGRLLTAMVHTTPATVRSHHTYGASDPDGFAAMGVVEVLAHMHDVAAGLGLPWDPPADLCDRALRRLFPDAPTDTERWPTLRWATGRGTLPGRPVRPQWRWDGTPR